MGAELPPPSVTRTQYTLRELLIGITVLGGCFGLAVTFGVFVLVPIYFAGLIAAAWFRWISWESAIAVIFLSLVLLVTLGPIFLAPYSYALARQNAARSNTRNIAIALQGYHVTHRAFPEIVTRSPAGEPLHSWRALILPHVERDDLYEQVEFSEPWDSPKNSTLHAQNIRPFQGVYYRQLANGEVSYFAVIMPNTKPGDPFAVIELPNRKVNYLEPCDITLAELDALAEKAPRHGNHQVGTAVHIAWPDGSVDLINLKEVPARLRERMGTR